MALALALQLTLLLQRMLLTESVVSRRSWTRRTHGTSIALGMRWHASSTFKCPVHDCNIFHCKLLRRPPGLACLLSSPLANPTKCFMARKSQLESWAKCQPQLHWPSSWNVERVCHGDGDGDAQDDIITNALANTGIRCPQPKRLIVTRPETQLDSILLLLFQLLN